MVYLVVGAFALFVIAALVISMVRRSGGGHSGGIWDTGSGNDSGGGHHGGHGHDGGSGCSSSGCSGGCGGGCGGGGD